MSALGQKQTFGSFITMSALPPKADIRRGDWDVRFVPKADISQLFDHLVGASEQLRRNSEAQCLRSFQVDDQLELGRLYHR
jgi:hypothetical protein